MDNIRKTKLICPINMKWPIAENRLKELKDKPGEFLKSDSFNVSNIPGVQYYIKIYPSDEEEENSGNTTLWFFVEYLNETFKIEAFFNIAIEAADLDNHGEFVFEKTNSREASFNIAIETADFDNHGEFIFEENNSRGGALCTTDELFDPENRFIVDGELIIQMYGYLMVEKDIQKKTESFGDHRDALCLGLWNQEVDKNITIIADGKEVTAHKWVLETCSPVFVAMFQSEMKEGQEKKIEIKDFSFGIIEKAIKLCYHQSLVTDATLEDEIKLLQFFDKYDIQPLKNDLEAKLISEIDETTVCRFINASLLSNALKLEKKCTKFLQICLDKKTPILDIRILDRDFAMKLLENAFCNVSK
uniref:BTB domain-containing protein n=1 Tax=Panagrolaimus sp. ES5 TaxID=591445 RepID=A0AC34FXC1_9BILA